MKIIKLALIALFFGVPLLVRAQEVNTSPVQAKEKATGWDKLTPLEKARKVSRIKGSRKIEIKPVKQTEGLKTGIVIAYGHVIPPPYKVESVDGKILINGIQVVPSLVADREVKPVQIPEDKKVRYRKMYEFEQEIKRKYYAGILLKNKDALQAEILGFAKNNELVKDAHWGNDMLVIDYRVGGGSMVSLRGAASDTVASAKTKENPQTLRTFIVKGIESGCILFDSDGGATPGCGDKKIVNEVMQNNGLSKDEKIERLAKWGTYESAMDIVENYNQQEWKTEGGQK